MPAISTRALSRLALGIFCTAVTFSGAGNAIAQVSPAEILNPDLKAAEAKYLPQLKSLNREISSIKFPFSFYLSRYVGLDPDKQAETDSRGLEFVRFHGRVVLKITGNYNAAFNADLLTQNERASRTFQDVVVPILNLVTGEIPPDAPCDAIGFELSYHARTPNKNYDYEGKEILVVLLERLDAFAFPQAADLSEQQDIVNRSEVFVNGNDFGLALGEKDPLNVDALARSVPRKSAGPSAASASIAMNQIAAANPGLAPRYSASGASVGSDSRSTPPPGGSVATPIPPVPPAPGAVESLQSKYQATLDELAKAGAAKFHLVDYAPPAFGVFQNRIVLQFTMRNPQHFDSEKSSIYKRAAQSFDLFLAPQLKDLLDKIPADAEFDAFDLSVLNQLASQPRASSEAVEFICPRVTLRQFANAEITNQQLIDQSIVLVNGVRIALNLQLVE